MYICEPIFANMMQLHKWLQKKLPARMSLWVVVTVTLLIVAVLFIMFRVSHQAIKEEALAKATQTLENTVMEIENTLQEVEVATNNMLWNVEHHLSQPEVMATYAQKIVEINPHIIGCAIAFEPNFYPAKGELFMVYSYNRNTPSSEIRNDYNTDSIVSITDDIVTVNNPKVIQPDVYGDLPYTEQNWYSTPIEEGKKCWIRPRTPGGTDNSTILTYSVPIHDVEGNTVGILAADISIDWFSRTVLEAKPFPHSYCTMLGRRGTFIIHPDSTKLHNGSVYDLLKEEQDSETEELVQSIMAGERGYRAINFVLPTSLADANELQKPEKCYVLYQPFKTENWKACIVCPERDIFGANQRLLSNMIHITIIGLVIIFFFCIFFTSWQFKPLDVLAHSAQNIAKGNFTEAIPRTRRKDEIGGLQNNFRIMQKALVKHIDDIKKSADVLNERNEALNAAYQQVQEVERVKAFFIHNVTDQMLRPVAAIDSLVANLREDYKNIQQNEVIQMSGQMVSHTQSVTALLDRLLELSQEKESTKTTTPKET